jgi:hypothetical protein
MSGFLDQGRPSAFVRFLGRRWVRVVAAVWIVVTIGAVAVYQTTVAPTFTADRFELWLAGTSERVVIGVDDEAGTVHVTGGQNGLSELVVDGPSMFVLASEVGAGTTDATWVEIPLASLDPAFRAFEPIGLVQALSRERKECAAPTSDANDIITVLVARPADDVATWMLCGGAWSNVAPVEVDVLTDSRSVKPVAVNPGPLPSVVPLSDLDDPDAVVSRLNAFI